MACREYYQWLAGAAAGARNRPADLDLNWLRPIMSAETRPADGTVRVQSVDAGGVPSEWVWARNAHPDRRLLYLHGGGYVSGNAGNYREFTSVLSNMTGCAVLAANYRVGPEDPFPAAVQDAKSAFLWMHGQGVDGARTATRTFIAGDSAGGGLTLSAMLALRDAGAPLPDAAVTISAWTDLANTGDSVRTRADADVIMRAAWLPAFSKSYLADADPRHPLASPLYADLSGLPPVLMQVGDAEVLLDDSVRVAEIIRAAGGQVILEVWPEMPHVWHIRGLPESQQAVTRIAEFVSSFR